MAIAVYILCALTSLLCAVMLIRAYRRHRIRLMLWLCICFIGMAGNNVILFFDLVVTGPELDLSIYRTAFGFGGLLVLVAGLIWET